MRLKQVVVIAATIGMVGATAGSARGATTLIRTAAAGACTASSLANPHSGGFIIGPGNTTYSATFQCGINQVMAPLDEIGAAVVYLKASAQTQYPTQVRICFRSMTTGASVCGNPGYSNPSLTGTQPVTAYPPAGNFDDDEHLAYITLTLYRSSYSYNYFYGFYVRTPFVVIPPPF